MATQRKQAASAARIPKGRSRSSFVPFLAGVIVTLLILPLAGWLYLRFGHPPVAVADTPLPFEAQIVHVPMQARIDGHLQQPPFGTSEDGFEAGAKIYQSNCAACHGSPGHDSQDARAMYPRPPQLWKRHSRSSVVGVSDDEPGETYWKVANGIRLSGMPSFQHQLNETQMWQVTLLLKNADQTLPDPVLKLLTLVPNSRSRSAP